MKLLIFFLTVLFLISCGNNSDTKEKSTTEPAATTEVTDPDAARGLALFAKSTCFTCHKLTETFTGPSYAAIASKYKTLTQPAMDSMVEQILKGGKGKWGTIPMPPQQVSKQDAELMVHY